MTPADLRQACFSALGSPNLRAFLAVIRAGEGAADEDGYRRLYGGKLFDSFADHPRVAIKAGKWTSTAAGAYQFLSATWAECAKALALPDFTPASQDLAAVFLIRRRGALPDAIAGRLDEAIAKCAKEWASLPGSPYGQPTRTLAQARATYLQAGGTLAQATPQPAKPQPVQEPSMPIPALVGALLPVLTSAVPELVKLIKPGSESAAKNAEVAGKVFEVAQQALGAVNAQDVVEQVQADPRAAQVVRDAVRAQWFTLSDLTQLHEADEDSRRVASERAVSLARETGGRWLWLVGALAALIVLASYGIVTLVLIREGFSDETRALLLGQIVILGFGTVVSFLFGSNLSNRVDQVQRQHRGQ